MSDKALLFIHALTGLHPGGGSALGVIDLPVQRERHTDWPTIPGASLKGVLRAACNRKSGREHDQCEYVLAAFGPPTSSASDHAGAVSFSDARILAFPVRSLTGVFAWVTCPSVLHRLSRDLGIVGGARLPNFPRPQKNAAASAIDSPLIVTGNQLILEEFEFSCSASNMDIVEWIASQAVSDRDTQDRIRTHMVILHDDDFTHFVRNATEVVARIGLDYNLKTVRQGALFYEEYLPPETLFYSLVLCRDSRRNSHGVNAADILTWLHKRDIDVLQIGGGETIGKGLCGVRFDITTE